MNNTFSLIITGDLVINQLYANSNISQEVIDLFKKSDINIVNLEAPVTYSERQILKTGPHLKADKKNTLDVLRSLKIDIVTLANNHLLDYGAEGVKDTLSFCKENKIETVGAGLNLKEASTTLFLKTSVGRIAIVNFAENEWASATEDTAGCHPMDIIENASKIKEAKSNADYVFVIIHGGHEYYNLPSPRMQGLYRFYAAQGADIVIGHHTHCINGNEEYNGIPIYYSLGNFIFTKPSSYEDWYTGLALEVNICNGKLSTKLHPIKQERESYKIDLLKHKAKDEILDRISSYNAIIEDSSKLREEWNSYIKKKENSYLKYWSLLSFINNPYIRAILNKMGLKLINKRVISYQLNLMRCEAHADISKEVIKKYLSYKTTRSSQS